MLYSKPLGPTFGKFYFGTQGPFLRTLIKDMAFWCLFLPKFLLVGSIPVYFSSRIFTSFKVFRLCSWSMSPV